MLSEDRASNSLTSDRGSIRDTRPIDRRSSIDEEDDAQYEEPGGLTETDGRPEPPPQQRDQQYIGALQHRFPSRPKSDYAYSAPIINTAGVTTSVTPTTRLNGTRTTTPITPPGTNQSTPAPGTNRGNTNGNTSSVFPRPNLRPVSTSQQNTYARRLTPPQSTMTTPGRATTTPTNVGVQQDTRSTLQRPTTTPTTGIRTTQNLVDIPIPIPIPTSTFMPSIRPMESTFERIDSRGGPVSYLGTGTWSQFEHCLRECLSRERNYSGITSEIYRHDIPGVRGPDPVSLINDYSYDKSIPYDSLRSSGYGYHDYPIRPAGALNLEDIQGINAALSKSGISVFPHHHHPGYYYDHHHNDQYHFGSHEPVGLHSYGTNFPQPRHRVIGEIVSACRIVNEEPFGSYPPSHADRVTAVQHVWNAIQNRLPMTQMMADPINPQHYAPPYLSGGSHPSSPSYPPPTSTLNPSQPLQTTFR
ncbi:unnamed protein product [Didymodactylos carnosus]|uniref:Uncharacterized protein n=1 Tax=Didymodactylos carnosus TaxID=1234261 RepID=A0A814MCC4_9BILA|nr:unnamed protein product [Didymodactylos carnosus]CAF3843982.1 unnamed protein product [Didymodactylos carnosus]